MAEKYLYSGYCKYCGKYFRTNNPKQIYDTTKCGTKRHTGSKYKPVDDTATAFKK